MCHNDLAQLEMLYVNHKEVQPTNSLEEKLASPPEQLLGSEKPAHCENGGEKPDEQGNIQNEAVDKEYIRNIVYIAARSNSHDARSMGLGIEVEEGSCASSHPRVKLIHQDSPLRGRIFRGDVILAVNNEETTDLGAHGTAEKIDSNQSKTFEGLETNPTMSVVELTVMSTESDGSVTESEGSDFFADAGVQETASEV